MGLIYYILDEETTGVDSKKHEIIQISIIRCSDRHQLSKFIKSEYPQHASFAALAVTGRTFLDLHRGEAKEDVVDICDNFFNEDGLTNEHRCIVGHNVHRFDLRFTHALWKKCNKVFPANLWLDTLPFIKAYAIKKGIDSKSFKLEAACDLIGIKTAGMQHNAISDTRNNYKLWLKLMDSGVDYLPFIKRAPHILDE